MLDEEFGLDDPFSSRILLLVLDGLMNACSNL